MTTRDELRRQGEAMRTRLFGTDAQTADLAPGFRDFLSETEFGIVWCRPGLALTDRMVCTLAVLACVQRHSALRRYVGAALNIGLDAGAIQEVLIQIGIYAGFTASDEALGTAAAVFAERGVEVPAQAPRNDARDRTADHDPGRRVHPAGDHQRPRRAARNAAGQRCRTPGAIRRLLIGCRERRIVRRRRGARDPVLPLARPLPPVRQGAARAGPLAAGLLRLAARATRLIPPGVDR